MLRTANLLTLVAMLLIGSAAAAAERKAAATDPAKAGPDFAVQGEYAGTIKTGQGDTRYGAQIIALGGGKFHGVGFAGGLPGDGWDKSERIESDFRTKDGVLDVSLIENVKIAIKEGAITVRDAGGDAIGTLKKVHRKSPTLGAKPPQGAVVLFDGSTADRFEGGRMTADKLLMEGVTSKQTFGSFTIHIEFLVPFMPDARGQGRGNSGFYAQGRYEVQILDSFGLKAQGNDCGAIYGVAPPSVNMSYPPLSWQTYDVDFTAAEWKDSKIVRRPRMTVRHNGVLIHDNVEIPRATTAAPVKEGLEKGPVYLQNHGNPVRFRNIWVVEK
jgi:hypothetical protein